MYEIRYNVPYEGTVFKYANTLEEVKVKIKIIIQPWTGVTLDDIEVYPVVNKIDIYKLMKEEG